MEFDNNQISEKQLDIKTMAVKAIRYWPFFLFSLLIALAGTFIINKFSVPVYSIKTTLLIQDDQSTDPDAIIGLDALNKLGNFQVKNEIGILKSYQLVERTIDQLDFEI